MENGAIWKVSDEGVEHVGRIDPKILFVDSWSRLAMDFHTMRRETKIGDSGMALVDGVFDRNLAGAPSNGDLWYTSTCKSEGWQEDLLKIRKKIYKIFGR